MASKDVELRIKATNKASPVLNTIRDSIDALKKAQAELTSESSDSSLSLEKLTKSFEKLEKEITSLSGLKELVSEFNKLESKINKLKGSVSTNQESLKIFKESYDNAKTAVAGLSNELNQLEQELKQQKTVNDATSKAIKDINNQIKENKKSYGSLNQTIIDTKNNSKELTNSLENQKKSLSSLRSLSSNLKPDILSGKATSADKKLFNQLEKEIIKAEKEFDSLNAKLLLNAIALESSKKQSLDLASSLKQLETRKKELNSQNNKEISQINSTIAKNTELNNSIKALSSIQKKAASDISKTEEVLKEQNNELLDLSSSYNKLGAEVTESAQKLQLAEASQKEIAEASKRATREVLALNKALNSRPEVRNVVVRTQGGVGSNRRQDLTQVRDQKTNALNIARELEDTRKKAAELGRELAKTATPSAELLSRFSQLRVETQNLKASFQTQITSLNNLKEAIKQAALARKKAEEEAALAARKVEEEKARKKAERLAAKQKVVIEVKEDPRLKELPGLLGSLARALNQVAGAGPGAANALLSLASGSSVATSAVRVLRNQVLGATTAYLSFFAAVNQTGKIVESFRDLEAARNRLGVVFDGDTGRTDTQLGLIKAQAEVLGLDFRVLANEYSKFTLAAKTSNIDLSVSNKLFNATAKAARVNKISVEQLEKVYLAFTQVIGKGKFTAEEVTQQLGDNLPAAVSIVEAAFKRATGSTENLFDAFQKGEVLATPELLTEVANELEQRFAAQLPDAISSASASFDRLNSTVGNVRRTIGEGGLVEALADVADRINEIAKTKEAQEALLRLGQALGDLVIFIADNINVIRNLIVGLTGLKVGLTIINLFKGFKQIIPIFTALNVAVGAASVKMLAFGGAVTTTSAGVLASTGRVTALSSVLKLTGLASSTAAASVTTFGNSLLAMRAKGGPLVKLLEVFVKGLLAVGVALGIGKGIEKLTEYSTELDGVAQANLNAQDTISKFNTALLESKGTVETIRESLNDLSEQEVNLQIDDLKEQLALSNESILELINSTDNLKAMTRASLLDLIKLYKAGEVSAAEFVQRVNSMSEADPGLREIAAELRDNIKESATLSTNLDKLQAILSIITNNSDLASQALAFLKNDLSDAGSAAAEASVDFATYEKSLNSLIRRTKKGREELERKDIVSDLDQGINALTNKKTGEIDPENVPKVIELLNAEKQATKEFEQSLIPKPKRERKPKKSDAEREAERLAKAQADLEKKLREDSEDRQFEIAQSSVEDERRKAIEAAARQAIVSAQRQGLQISKEQVEVIRQETALLFDIKNKRKAAEDAERNVNELLENRRLIQERINFLEQRGGSANIEASTRLQEQLVGVEAKIANAADEAIKFAKALGDDNLVLKLEIIKQSLEQVTEIAGLSAREINQSFAQGGANAIDNFAKSITEGVSVFQALGDAARQFFSDFLRQIAQAIAQQAILNAIGVNPTTGGGGAGGFLSSIIGSIFHDGGVVGSSAPTATYAASTWLNANRYHTGGIAGLKPDEVPAILQKNEEVITANDPRHRNNGGASPSNIKVVNTINPSEFISQGLSSSTGEQAILNFIRSNKTTVKSILGS